MDFDAAILRLLPASLDHLATLAEGRTPQHSVVVQEDLVVDISFRKCSIEQLKHLRIKVAKRCKLLPLPIDYKVDWIIKEHNADLFLPPKQGD